MKNTVRVIIFFSLCILAGCSSFSTKDHSQTTNTQATLYTLKEQKEILRKMPQVYSLAFSNNQKENGTYIVPGLISSQTLDTSNKGSIAFSQSMDPQGVTVAEDYLLICCYSHEKKYHSVIYVLDKKSHHYIKTVVLKDRPHVGGITYDAANQMIWICDDQEESQEAQISSISLSDLKTDQFEKSKKPIEYNQTIKLSELHRASFISYHENSLYVGDFSDKKNGKLHKYSINQTGSIQSIADRKMILVDDRNEEQTIPKKIQGVTFYQDRILLSQSYGANNSAILLLKDTKDHFSLENDQEKEIAMPPYLEQISVYDHHLFAIFESATQRFRRKPDLIKVDRVIQLDVEKLIVGSFSQ